MGVSSLILGILSFLISLTWFADLSLILGVLALVLGIIAIVKKNLMQRKNFCYLHKKIHSSFLNLPIEIGLFRMLHYR